MELQPSIMIAIISLFYDYNEKNIGQIKCQLPVAKINKQTRFNLLVAFLYGL